MAYTSSLFSETANIHLENGAIIYDVDNVYLVISDNANDGPLTVMAEASQPTVGPDRVPFFGETVTTPFGVDLFTRHIGNPIRPDGHEGKTKWHVPVHFDNRANAYSPVDISGQPVQDPLNTPQAVDIKYIQTYVPHDRARFVGTYDRNDVKVQDVPLNVDGTGALTDYVGLVRNSSTAPNYDVKRQDFQKQLMVTRVVRDWNQSWEDLLGKTNDALVTVTQSDQDGARYTESYGPGELQLASIKKRDFWTESKLYFHATFVLIVDKEKNHQFRNPDVGVSMYIFDGQFKAIGNLTDKWTFAQLQSQNWPMYFPTIKEGWFQPITAPIELNGYGRPVPWQRPEAGREVTHGGYYTLWDISDPGDFSILGIT